LLLAPLLSKFKNPPFIATTALSIFPGNRRIVLRRRNQIAPQLFGNLVFRARYRSQRLNQATNRKRNGGRIMNMRGFWLGLAVGTISICLLGQWVFSAASKETDPPKGISPEIVADYIHSVVKADRTFYETEIVDRMQMRGVVSASEQTETSRYPPNF
jgi:hypothetical protein